MPFASVPLSRVLTVCGIAYVLAILLLIVSKAPLGSGIFVAVAVVATTAYAAILMRVWDEAKENRTAILTT